MRTTYIATIEGQLNRSTSLAPRLARGSSSHDIVAYAARYDADHAELQAELAACTSVATVQFTTHA